MKRRAPTRKSRRCTTASMEEQAHKLFPSNSKDKKLMELLEDIVIALAIVIEVQKIKRENMENSYTPTTPELLDALDTKEEEREIQDKIDAINQTAPNQNQNVDAPIVLKDDNIFAL